MTTETQPTSMPAVGDEAADFTLNDDTGAPRRLGDGRGRWLVLFFYPKDDTPGCTKEACAFRDADERIRAQDAEVWGISIKGTGSKAAFKQKFGLPFTLLADEDHAVADRYGAWVRKTNYGKEYWGVQRITFLVDPEGRIAKVWPKVSPGAHAEEVLRAITEARAA